MTTIFNPSAVITSTANADNSYKAQRFIATAGQTVFTLTTFAYQVSTGSIVLEINGVAQFITEDFTETSNTSITLTTPAEVGDVVVIRGFIGGTNAVAAEASASAAEVSKLAADASAVAALAAYDAIIALGLPSLPLTIANGGTGQITKAAAFLALAPTPVSGKVIGSLDGVTFGMITLTEPAGKGGGVFTADETLVASSAAMRVVRPTVINTYTTLPDATTLDTGIALFTIFNESYFDRGIKDSTGKILGWVRPMQTSVLGLVDKTTAAGVWNITNLCKAAVVSQFSNTSLTNSGSFAVSTTVDADRQLIVFGGTSVYGVVYNSSTDTYGSVVLLTTGISAGNVKVTLHSTDKLLLTTYSSTPTIDARVITLTGNAISVGSKVSSALPAGLTFGIFSAVLVNDVIVVSYVYNNAGYVSVVRPITISGTVPTFGAEYTLPPTTIVTSIPLFNISNTVVLAYVNSGTLYCRAYSVSGATLTTGAETSTTCSGNVQKYFVTGNNRLFFTYVDGSIKCALYSLTGVNISQSIVSLGGGLSTVNDIGAITSNKTLVTMVTSSTSGCNVVTDTSGTASVGTFLSLSASSTPVITMLVSNTAYVQLSAYGDQVIDCSGTSPTSVAIRNVSGSAESFTPFQPPANASNSLAPDPRSFIFPNSVSTISTNLKGITQTIHGQSLFYSAATTVLNLRDASTTEANWSYVSTATSITLVRLRGAE